MSSITYTIILNIILIVERIQLQAS